MQVGGKGSGGGGTQGRGAPDNPEPVMHGQPGDDGGWPVPATYDGGTDYVNVISVFDLQPLPDAAFVLLSGAFDVPCQVQRVDPSRKKWEC
ncbi:hypothetical protein GCM10023063_15670 [Arthrobacter methylotrophus]